MLIFPWRRAALVALSAFALVCFQGPGGAGDVASTGVVAVSASVTGDVDAWRMGVVLSGDVRPSSFQLEQPDRIIVELPGVNCQLGVEAARRTAGLVGAYRCGLFALGRTRLVLELNMPAVVSRLALADGPVDGTKLLTVEVTKVDRETFRRGARRVAPEPDFTGSVEPLSGAAGDGRPLVAIDPGHGGIDPGATAASGDLEKDVVLAFARALRDRLVASGRVRVMMTRDADVFVALDERVRSARAAGADLFVSIHGDSISSPSVRGATVYTGAERATDAESARLADRENAADAAAGLLPAEARALVPDILAELTLRETRGLSRRFATMLQADLSGTMRFSAQPHREAGFRVLRAPDMSSVLVELGYLSNAKDAGLLLSEEWRARGAAAMSGAIERFFGPNRAARAAVSP